EVFWGAGEVVTIVFPQVRDPRRQGADDVAHAFRWLTVGRRRCLKERLLERHADDVRRPASQAPGCSPGRTTVPELAEVHIALVLGPSSPRAPSAAASPFRQYAVQRFEPNQSHV